MLEKWRNVFALTSIFARQKKHKQQHSKSCHEHNSQGHSYHNYHGPSTPFTKLSAVKRKNMHHRLLWAIAINIGITVLEVIIGIWANSMALLSDALHNFSDVLALLLSLIGLYLLNREVPLNEKTFGYQRVELIIGLINGISLIFIGLFALRSALVFFVQQIANYFNGTTSSHNMLGLPIFVASLFSVIFNGISVYILERGEHHSVSMRSSILHLFSDMLTSVAVCIAGIVIYFFQIYWIDALISIVIATYIIISSFSLAKYSVRVLLNFNITGLNIADIRAALCGEAAIHSVFHVHLWSLSEATVMLEAHIGVIQELTLSELNELTQKLKNILRQEFHIDHVTLEFHAATSEWQECELADRCEGTV